MEADLTRSFTMPMMAFITLLTGEVRVPSGFDAPSAPVLALLSCIREYHFNIPNSTTTHQTHYDTVFRPSGEQ